VHGLRQLATSVVLDPDGRIVIAGTRDQSAMVLRLLPDGSVDDAFGASGLAIGPSNLDFSSDGSGARTSIIRVADGGYRLTASNPTGCQLFALTANGAIESGFGGSGIVTGIDNRRLAQVAKLAGAPDDKAAGVELHVHLDTRVEAGEPLYTVHAETPGELDYSLAYVATNGDIVEISGD